jgi:small subunit ribosomal protein S16
MAVKMRLQRHGRKQAPFYHIVVADSRSPRDGRFLERVGYYNPLTKPATIELDRDLAFDWIMKGAQPTDTVATILRFKGVMYRKHLARGVRKGALTQEQADEMYNRWVEEKERTAEKTRATSEKEKEDYHKRLFGTPKPKKEVPAPVAEEAPAAEETSENAEGGEESAES